MLPDESIFQIQGYAPVLLVTLEPISSEKRALVTAPWSSIESLPPKPSSTRIHRPILSWSRNEGQMQEVACGEFVRHQALWCYFFSSFSPPNVTSRMSLLSKDM
jgi:hypothetical protein